MKAATPTPTGAQLRELQSCLCLALRRTTRIVTQRYDAALRPFGLRVTQLPILSAAATGDGVPVAPLADRLGMDRTTLLRIVRPLVRRHLVDVRRAAGHRHDELRATAKGRVLLARVYPAWRRAQDAIRAQISDPAWRLTLNDLGRMVRQERRP
jgi:DNA-binding MarR family transcriptional regulator